MKISRIAVLGAGIQGVCTSLELARLGYQVDLFDQELVPMQATSTRNEGKIHLGLVYAKDPSLKTARLMLEGALQFMPLLSRFVGADAFQIARPFDYLVANDSMISAASIARHFDRVAEICATALGGNTDLNYLGRRPDSLHEPLSSAGIDRVARPGRVVAAFKTQERAIETTALAGALTHAIQEVEEIRFHGRYRIDGIERAGNRYLVSASTPTGTWSAQYDQVVNALWSDRLRIDASLGVPLPRAWNYRLKLRVLCDEAGYEFANRSFTMLLGPYGDVVHYPNGTVYVSWYPSCLRDWSQDLAPPRDWAKLCRGVIDHDEQQALGKAILADAGRDWIPCLSNMKPLSVTAGIICGSGDSDIDVHDSGLHRRDEAGVCSWDGYHSVNTGKYTTAPLFASRVAARVAARADGRQPPPDHDTCHA